jgi:hypothetical protein
MGLLNGLAEATAGEVNLTTEALGVVITEPVLEKRGAVGNSSVSPGERFKIGGIGD